MSSNAVTATLNRVYDLALLAITTDIEPEVCKEILVAISHSIERDQEHYGVLNDPPQ